MSAVYDNWEKLAAAVVKELEIWRLFHEQSRSPSVWSESSSPDSRSPPNGLLDFSFRQLLEDAAIELQQFPPELVFVSDCGYSFGIDDVLRASTVELGQGTFGSAFKLIVDGDLTLVLKRLKWLSVSEQDFERQMEILGNIRHENVASLLAYCSDKYEKLVLYEHCESRSVSTLLHGRLNDGDWADVDWETRKRIAVGAARGICHIHAQNDGKLVHGNIKASNIFLNSQGYGLISDIGLANMIETTFTRTACCYAPEVNNTQKVSQASDVYSYGVLLIQLLTRKSPTHVANGPEAVDLVKLIKSVKGKLWVDKVFDRELSGNPQINKQMERMLHIGTYCVAKSPKKRPKMSQVVDLIKHLVPLGLLMSLTFRLRISILSRRSYDLGKVYYTCAALDKNEFDSMTPFMDVITRIKLENISKIAASYYSKDEKLVVYECCNRYSLSVMLQGSIVYQQLPFNWITRLRTMVGGAAEGTARIHSQGGGGSILRGNIYSSYIFCAEQQYGHAPDVIDYYIMSRPADVYSFGFVLLEVLIRKRPKRTTDDCDDLSLVRGIRPVRAEPVDKTFDAELLRYDTEEEAMVKTFQLGIRCVAFNRAQGPKMAEVVEMLNDVNA